MKVLKYITFCLLFFNIVACNNGYIGSVIKIKYAWYQWDSLKNCSSGFLYDSISKNRKLFQYLDNDPSLIFRLDINFKNDTVILFNGVQIEKLDEHNFFTNNDTVIIYKYLYDEDIKSDEEAFVFINFSIGIIGINYFPWDLSVFPEGENIPKDLKKVLLKSVNE